MKTLLLCIYILVSCTIYANCKSKNQKNYIDYHNLVNEAEYIYKERKQYKEAIKLYREAERNFKYLFAKDYYYLARCYARLHKTKKMKRALICYASSPLSFYKWPLNDSDYFEAYKNKPYFNRFIMSLSKFDSIKRLQINLNSVAIDWAKLNEFDSLDQYIRKEWNSQNNDSQTWHIADSTNQENFYSYINQNGFPDYYKTGNETVGVTILLHLNKTVYEKIKPILYKYLIEGRIIPYFYARMIDRIEFDEYGKCTNYSYFINNPYAKCKWNKEDIIKEKKKLGVSIYYKGPRNRINQPDSKIVYP